jgi:predicted small lipoprotein YifL
MKTIKNTARLLAILALCASVSACGQANPSASASFPSYGSQAAVSSQYVAPSILDY